MKHAPLRAAWKEYTIFHFKLFLFYVFWYVGTNANVGNRTSLLCTKWALPTRPVFIFCPQLSQPNWYSWISLDLTLRGIIGVSWRAQCPTVPSVGSSTVIWNATICMDYRSIEIWCFLRWTTVEGVESRRYISIDSSRVTREVYLTHFNLPVWRTDENRILVTFGLS